MLTVVDINCDMGELTEDNRDAEFMPFISSCNVCCGSHAGSDAVIKKTVEAAVTAGITIGAHPGYPDRENFGRLSMALDDRAVRRSIANQLASFRRVVESAGGALKYIKPHGALYNDMVGSPSLAAVVLSTIIDCVGPLPVYGLANSRLAEWATSHGVRFIHEVFADRRYESDLTLMARSKKGAVTEEESDVIRQIDGFVRDQVVVTADGKTQAIIVDSICIHGDTPRALDFARRIHKYLQENNVQIASPL